MLIELLVQFLLQGETPDPVELLDTYQEEQLYEFEIRPKPLYYTATYKIEAPEPEPPPEPEPEPKDEVPDPEPAQPQVAAVVEPEPPLPQPEVVHTVPWDAIAQCESSGDWSINTGNGYYGGLQFNKESWDWAGGQQYAEYPHQATREQQIATAEKLKAMHPAGLGAWPSCTRQLGLR